jgi:NAD(P)H-dependent FMN reductase
MVPKILVFAGSTKATSVNARLADAAQLTLAHLGADVTRISLLDYPLPLVNEDLKSRDGVPENAMKLGRIIAANDGVFIASPEYNASIPPLLKNTIDWVSLISTDGEALLKPWRDRYVTLGGASPGRLGGIRSLQHLRAVMVDVGAQVTSQQVSVSGASSAFDDDGSLVEERSAVMLEGACKTLVDHCKRHGMRQ